MGSEIAVSNVSNTAAADGTLSGEYIDSEGKRVRKTISYDDNGNRIETIETIQEDENQKVTQIQVFRTDLNGHIEKVPEFKRNMNIPLNGNVDAPTDDGISKKKTPEQEANLAKLTGAKEFLNSDAGKALEKALVDSKFNLTKKQKKELKKANVDIDAFMQVLNKKHENVRFNEEAAAEKLDDMGALANTFLGEDTATHPQNRQPERTDDVRNPDKRSFFAKLFTKKEKQNVKDDKKYSQVGGTKVNIHSSQVAQRNAELVHDISDDAARAGNAYLDAFKDGYKGNKKEKYTVIDDDGNATKVKVIYRKDGSVKKVVTKSNEKGKLLVRENKDGHVSIRGNLQSDNIYDNEQRVYNKTELLESHSAIENKCPTPEPEPEPVTPTPPAPVPTPPVPTPPAPVPTPPAPVRKIEKPGGLIEDFVNDAHTNGMGNVQGNIVREQMDKYGAAEMVKGYCSYTDKSAPNQVKILMDKNHKNKKIKNPNGTTRTLKASDYSQIAVSNAGNKANIYNAEHIAQALINDFNAGVPNEKQLAAFITELKKQGKTEELKAVRTVISNHNKQFRADARKDEATRTVDKPVTTRETAIAWLLKAQLD